MKPHKLHIAIDGVNQTDLPQTEPTKALALQKRCPNCAQTCEVRTADRAMWCRNCETFWIQDEDGNWVGQ